MATNRESLFRSTPVLMAVVGALSLGSLVLGQGQNPQPPVPGSVDDPNKLKPPVPAPPRSEASDVLGIVFAVVLGAAVVGVNMIPGRRSHQD